MEEQIRIILEKALAVAEATGEFAMEQAPLLLQEFYTWQLVSHIFMLVLGIILIIGIPLALRSFLPEDKDGYFIWFFWKKINDDYTAGAWVPCVLGWLFGIPIFGINLYNLIMLLVAPKLYLIQHFTSGC